MGRINRGGHVRTLGGNTQYRLIRLGKGPQVLEHRYVMEQHLGRKLFTSEIVHHIDGNGLNNDISNLEVMSQGTHRIGHSGPFKWDIGEGIRLKNAGFSITEISKRLGVSQPSVSKAFIRRGIDTYTRRSRKFCWGAAMILFSMGYSTYQIGSFLGVKGPSIRRVLVKNGLV